MSRTVRICIVLLVAAYYLVVSHFTMGYVESLYITRWTNLTIGPDAYLVGYILLPTLCFFATAGVIGTVWWVIK